MTLVGKSKASRLVRCRKVGVSCQYQSINVLDYELLTKKIIENTKVRLNTKHKNVCKSCTISVKSCSSSVDVHTILSHGPLIVLL